MRHHAQLAMLLVAVAMALLGDVRTASAQRAGRVPRIGSVGTAPSIYTDVFTRALSDLGYVENRTVEFDRRYTGGKPERFPELVAALVDRKVDVLVATSEPAARAARTATATIPIVMVVADDPVESGLVPSLNRPGGNMTGFSSFQPDLVGKRLQLLKELVPGASRVAVLGHAGDPAVSRGFKEAETVAAAMKLTVHAYRVSTPGEIDAAFADLVAARPHGLIVLQNFWMYPHRGKVVELAARAGVPAVYGHSDYVVAGGLVSYSPDSHEPFERAAAYVDKILKGAKPGDLPIERSSKFALAINVKTATALGLTVPPSVLLRADQIVQ